MAYLEVSARDEFVGYFGNDAADNPAIEESYVGDPEHAKDQRAHKNGKVGASSGRGQVTPCVQARDVTDVDTGELVLKNSSEISEFFSELRLQGSLHGHFFCF
jgi:hypothetical protein